MVTLPSHYTNYDVMNLADEWDDHTKKIVTQRLAPFPTPGALNEAEVRTVKIIASHLIYDDRDQVLAYIVHHLDSKLSAKTGESQRKVGSPKERDLILHGLKALDLLAQDLYQLPFAEADTQAQLNMLEMLQQGQVPQITDWSLCPPKELFKKLLSIIVDAYYSHPIIWSEIGYGGPAYPRGYVRVELGLTDPWEAKKDGQ
ncbi:gluconate 2-dehydrogenase subunit 3 family protein [Peptococcaceae bacterium 1198_IL3148]